MTAMKKFIITALLLIPMMAAAQEGIGHEPDQIRVGWGGYPVMESLFYMGFGCGCDLPPGHSSLDEIYHDYTKPMFSTGIINAELSWFHKDWFTFSFTTAVSLTWQGYRDAVTDKRTGSDIGFNLYLVPQARFNWVRREWVKMYSTIGIGAVAGINDEEFAVLPAAQLTPVGIEVGRKLFGFGEIGLGMLHVGGQIGIGYRF